MVDPVHTTPWIRGDGLVEKILVTGRGGFGDERRREIESQRIVLCDDGQLREGPGNRCWRIKGLRFINRRGSSVCVTRRGDDG